MRVNMKVSGMHEHGDHGVSVHLRQVVAQDDSVPRVDLRGGRGAWAHGDTGASRCEQAEPETVDA